MKHLFYIKNLSLLFLLFSIFIVACSKETKSDVNESILKASDKETLASILTDYQSYTLNPSEIYSEVLSQSNTTKSITLIKDELSFELEASSHVPTYEFYAASNSEAIFEKVENVKGSFSFFDNYEMDMEENKAALGISKESLRAEFVKDGSSFVLAPLSEFIREDKSNLYILYDTKSVIAQDQHSGTCFGHDTHVELTENVEVSSRSSHANMTVTIDYNFYNVHGWQGSIDYVLNAIYWAGTRYSNSGMDVSFSTGSGYIFTSPNQWGLYYNYDTATYLNNYAAWLSTYGIGNDINLLFTHDHAHWGGSYPGTACGYNAVAVMETHWNVWRRNNIIAHEIGHICGFPGNPHASSGVMTWDSNGSTFNYASKNTILNWVNAYGYCM